MTGIFRKRLILQLFGVKDLIIILQKPFTLEFELNLACRI